MIKMIIQVLDPNKKINNEEIVNVLNVMRYIFVKVKIKKKKKIFKFIVFQ